MNTNTPTITMQPVESSQIEAIGYDEETATLAVRFIGKGDKPAQTYHYRNVGPTEWAAMRDAPSPGSHLFRHIKPHPDRYPYIRVEEAPAE